MQFLEHKLHIIYCSFFYYYLYSKFLLFLHFLLYIAFRFYKARSPHVAESGNATALVITSKTDHNMYDTPDLDQIGSQEEAHDTALDYKGIVESLNIYDSFPDPGYMKESMRMDYSAILNKPFHVDSFDWRTSDSRGYLRQYKVPYSFLRSSLAKIPFLSSTYWRGNICVILSVSGTPMHQGTIIASAQPHNAGSKSVGSLNNVNTQFASPHVLLSPNNATATCLEFPFYYPVHYMKTMIDDSTQTTTDCPYYNSGYLVFTVLNPLQGGSTSSNSVSVNISVKFDKLEFYVPKPILSSTTTVLSAEAGIVSGYIDGFFNGLKNMGGDLLDSCRSLVKYYTGLHQPNLPVLEHVHRRQLLNYHNPVEGPTFIERMDPFINHDRLHSKPYFNTKVDEMFMPFLLSKPQYLNTFTVRATDVIGTLLASIPISPYQIINKDRTQQSLQNLFYLSSRYWRGNIVIYLQSSMSNMHFLKTLCVKQYATRPNGVAPLFDDVLNLPSESVEFSSGGQIAKIVIPYYQDKGQIYCTTNSTVNALLTGRFNIYLQQPLVNSGTTADNVSINVFYALEDFNFYGHNVNTIVPFLVTSTDDDVNQVLPIPPPVAPLVTTMQPESSFTPYNVNNQQMLESVNVVVDEQHSFDMRPIVSVRDYVRRYQQAKPIAATSAISLTQVLRDSFGPIIYLYNGFLGGVPSR